jgi:CRISPR-associated protein Csx10
MLLNLEIKLLSAVAPGSGEGWAGVIDSDVVFDELGLPYIPARRIKGILREMATDVVAALQSCGGQDLLNVRDEDIKSLFGDPGQSGSSPLSVDNAYLEEYEQIREWIRWAQHKAPHLATPDRVISTFTHWRQQTAIDLDEGVAKENSLRITRTLNQGYKFVSRVGINEEKEEHRNLLALAVQVTHYLGSKRNRGLGRIECRLLDAVTNADLNQQALTLFSQWQA